MSPVKVSLREVVVCRIKVHMRFEHDLEPDSSNLIINAVETLPSIDNGTTVARPQQPKTITTTNTPP